jgi:hypothetical protein
MVAPDSDLPELSDEQKEVARKFNISEKEYAQGVLAGSYGQERMRGRAQKLGEAVQEILEKLGGGRVIAVVRDIDRLGWSVRVETPVRDVSVVVSQELANDILDSGSPEMLARLKARIAASVKHDHDSSGG